MNVENTRILVVEDDPDDLFLIMRTLGLLKLTDVVTVSDGEEAQEYLYRRSKVSLKHLPHVIITDVRMPKMSGIDLLKAIRFIDYTRDIPVVMLSSSIQEREVQACGELGILAYLRKPVAREDVERILPSIASAPQRSEMPMICL